MDANSSYTAKRIVLFLAISVGYLVVFFQRVAPAIVGPVMAPELGLDATAIGVMASMYFWAQALGCIPAGLLADTIGPRKIISIGLVCAAAGTVMFSMANSLGMVAVGRFVIGISVSVVFVGAMKIFANWYRANELATCSGVLLSVGNVGALLSTAPLMLLINGLGWRNAFLGVAAYTLFSGLVAWVFLRDTPKECGYNLDFIQTNTEKIKMGEAIKDVLGHGNFWLVFLSSFFFYGTVMTVGGLWSGPFIQDVYGLSKTQASSIVMFFTLGMICGCPLSGYLSDKVFKSRKKVLAGGAAANALSYIPLVFFTGTMPVPMLYAAFALFGLTGGFFVVCFATVKETTKPIYAATAVGVDNMAIAVGAALLQNVCGIILDAFGKSGSGYGASAYQAIFGLCMACMVLSCLIMLFFKEGHSQDKKTAC